MTTTTGDTAVTARLHAYTPTTDQTRVSVTSFTIAGVSAHIAIGIHLPGTGVQLHALTPEHALALGRALLAAVSC